MRLEGGRIVLGRFLFGVGSADPLTFSLTALLPAGVDVAACWLPARRALRAEPATLLRSD